MNLARELQILIRARYPLLYIVSSEEIRVQEMLLEVARERGKKLFE